MPVLTITQVAKNVPIYSIFDNGADIGSLTVFPGEGPMATIRVLGQQRTVSGATIHECLYNAEQAYWGVHAENENRVDEDFIPDEDGDIAFAQMLERRAEGPWGMDDEEIPF